MKTQIGLDLGSYNLKAVEITNEGKTNRVITAGAALTKEPLFLSESKLDQDKMKQSIRTFLSDLGLKSKKAVVSLSESQTFTRIIETPKLSEKELNQALKWEAEQYIPMPLDSVNMDFVVLNPNLSADTMQILLVAAPSNLVHKYVSVLNDIGIEVGAIENEGVALLRVFKNQTKNRLVLNLAATSTNLYIFSREMIVLARAIATGANVITRALSTDLSLPPPSAEEYKKSYGLNETAAEGKIAAVIKPFIENLISEISQSLTFFKEKYPNEVISEIILTGGGALMPNLSNYLSSRMQLPVFVGNPWEGLVVERRAADKIKGEETMLSVATGLALRGDY